MKRFRPEEKLLISHHGRKFDAECRKVIEETALQALQLELKVNGVLLSGHLVQLSADGEEFVPCLVRESRPEGEVSTIVVQAMADWRVTPRRSG
jgi:hypothetical protein